MTATIALFPSRLIPFDADICRNNISEILFITRFWTSILMGEAWMNLDMSLIRSWFSIWVTALARLLVHECVVIVWKQECIFSSSSSPSWLILSIFSLLFDCWFPWLPTIVFDSETFSSSDSGCMFMGGLFAMSSWWSSFLVTSSTYFPVSFSMALLDKEVESSFHLFSSSGFKPVMISVSRASFQSGNIIESESSSSS